MRCCYLPNYNAISFERCKLLFLFQSLIEDILFGVTEWKVGKYKHSTKESVNDNRTRICAAEMAVRYAALCACRKVHVCHCNSLGGATWRSVTITGRTVRQTDRQTDRRTVRVRRNMRPPPREEGRIIKDSTKESQYNARVNFINTPNKCCYVICRPRILTQSLLVSYGSLANNLYFPSNA